MIVLQPLVEIGLFEDNAIVNTGDLAIAVVRARQDFAVIRYNSDGTLDGTFGTGGLVTHSLRSDYALPEFATTKGGSLPRNARSCLIRER